MKKLFKLSVILSVFAIAFAFNPTTAKAADPGNFDLTVKHNINGISVGTDKDLPVDVFVDGAYQFTFNFRDIVETELPAGDYFIEVKFAGTETVVMSLQTGQVPEGVDVTIKAQLSGMKTPALKVRVNK